MVSPGRPTIRFTNPSPGESGQRSSGQGWPSGARPSANTAISPRLGSRVAGIVRPVNGTCAPNVNFETNTWSPMNIVESIEPDGT
jgi:hypothetical protein